MNCPLCSAKSTFYTKDKKRSYQQCLNCDLVFVPDDFILSEEKEKAEYDFHENDPQDPGYRKFLSRIFDPISELAKPPAKGLDFGCGPGPALYQMFEEAGYKMSLYDPYYFPDKEPLSSTYDFITSTEVIEHVRIPDKVFDKLFEMLSDNGTLGLMTKMVLSKEAFQNWHYKNDPTHIRFYSRKTFDLVAEKYSRKAQFIGNDVILFI